MFNHSTILITGGTGSWGIELIQQLLSLKPKKIIIFSRNENSHVLTKRKFDNDKLQFFIGDIRDRDAMVSAMAGVDYVFHLAALKHVPICEENPLEAFKTNVLGTYNVIEGALQNNVKKVVYVSTDKAADPANTYGMTKALGEKLIIHAHEKSTTTKFFCLRGGNVLGSNGSVLPLFQKQLKEDNKIFITNKKMTRYFVTPKKAIEVLLQACEIGNGGEIFVMQMKACGILDLAEVLIEHLQKSNVEILETGARRGEKLHEVLIAENEVPYAKVLNNDLIQISFEALKENNSLPPALLDATQSLMTKEEVKTLLLEGNFLK